VHSTPQQHTASEQLSAHPALTQAVPAHPHALPHISVHSALQRQPQAAPLYPPAVQQQQQQQQQPHVLLLAAHQQPSTPLQTPITSQIHAGTFQSAALHQAAPSTRHVSYQSAALQQQVAGNAEHHLLHQNTEQRHHHNAALLDRLEGDTGATHGELLLVPCIFYLCVCVFAPSCQSCIIYVCLYICALTQHT